MHPVVIVLLVILALVSVSLLGYALFSKSTPPTQPTGCKFSSECSGSTPVCKTGKCEKCTAHSQCPASKKICNEGLCVVCALDSHCDEDAQCENGVCVPRTCSDHNDCRDDERCENGKCVPIPCEADAECEKPLVCQNGKCTFVCAANSDCKDGEMCQGNRCVPIPCTQNVECPSGLMCKDGQCIRECSADAECKDGFVCDGGRCQENFICRGYLDCGWPSGTYCRQGVCARPCIDNRVCPDGSECIEGSCQRTRLPCPPGHFLLRGVCVKALCNPIWTKVCRSDGFEELRCKQDAECGPGNHCVNNVCIPIHRSCGPWQFRNSGGSCRNLYNSYANSVPSKAPPAFVMFKGDEDKSTCLNLCRQNAMCGMAVTGGDDNNCVMYSNGADQSRKSGVGETHIRTPFDERGNPL